MNCLPNNTATRRYTQRAAIAMGIYMLTIFAAVHTFKLYHPSGALAYALALLPALPIFGILVTVGLYLSEEKDEFQRNLFIQALVWAIGATLAVTTVWGSLENFTGAAHLEPFWIFPMFWIFVALSSALLQLRYR